MSIICIFLKSFMINKVTLYWSVGFEKVHFCIKSGYIIAILFLFVTVHASINIRFYSSRTRSNGTPLQYSCLENPMDGGAWWAAVHGVAKSRTRLSDFTFTFLHWRRQWQPTPVFLPGESQGRGSLVGCHLWGRTESGMTEAT